MKMLVTVNISKGFSIWKEMAASLNPEMEKVGVNMVWAGCNPDESQVFMVVEMQDPAQMKTFGEREVLKESYGNYFSEPTRFLCWC
jgi:S-adenosylhomocysteine hydrolase